jgi:hypothetical protein
VPTQRSLHIALGNDAGLPGLFEFRYRLGGSAEAVVDGAGEEVAGVASSDPPHPPRSIVMPAATAPATLAQAARESNRPVFGGARRAVLANPLFPDSLET